MLQNPENCWRWDRERNLARTPKIAIVGSGIVGASIAWHLSRSGAQPVVIEAGEAGGLATRSSWAWINASWGNPEPYFRLRHRSMAMWHDLERDVSGITVAWGGGLIWDMPTDELDAYARQHSAWGYGIARVGALEAQRIEPQLASPPERALYVAEEGAVEPLAATLALLAAAKSRGAEIIPRQPVLNLVERAGKLVGVETDGGMIDADEVVLAAGVATPELAAPMGIEIPMTAPPGLLVVSKPHSRLLNGLVMAPEMHLRQTADGRVIAGDDFGGSDPGEDALASARAVFDQLKNLLRSGETLEFDHFSLGYRPTPGDGFPVVGRPQSIAGLYLATMHSGITLAPAVGSFAASEILTGRRDVLLAPFGPDRFAAGKNQ